jgi:hypothetical protein
MTSCLYITMTRTHKAKPAENFIQDYSIHDPNNNEISRQQQDKHFEKLKKLITALKSSDK